MKVYYNSGIWCKGKGLWGLPQRVNFQFEYVGAKRHIPVIYRFSKGIVFDVLTILDETKLREFFKKYKAYEGIEETLTPLQRRCIEQEHPYQAVPVSEIWINGRQAEDGYSASGGMSVPWAQQDIELTPVRKAYSYILKDTACFACERFCVPYPQTDSKIQKLLRFLRLDRVRRIKLSTYPMQWFFPLDMHFEMSADEKQKELCFTHPVTGEKYTLYFQSAESTELPIKTEGNRSVYIMQSMYEIEPALPQTDMLQFGSSIQYTSIPEISDDKFSPASASSIGIIGGADGPTAVFISSKEKGKTVLPRGLHGLPLHSCLSVPSFCKGKSFHFHLEGINTEVRESKEYIL